MRAAELSPAQKAQVLAGMLLALFLGALDQTVVATAGPQIQRELHLDTSLYAWLTTAYLVASTVLVPVYGRLSDLVGRRRVVLFGVLLFVGASVLCGLCTAPWQLLACRALQGAGSASLFTSAFSAVADLYSPSERGRYSGLFGAVFGAASLIGPLLGGFLTDAFGWRWVFLINVPLGAVALGFIVWRMPPLIPEKKGSRVDVPGALLLAVAVVPLLISLSLGRPESARGDGFGWTDAPVLGGFALSLLGALALVAWELRTEHPLLDVRLFRDPVLRWGHAAVFVLGGAFLTPMVFLPLFMVNVVGVSATQSGLTITPLVLGVVAGNLVSGQLVSRLGRYRVLMLLGLGLQLAGFGVMALTLRADSSQAEVTAKMVLLGLGMGPSIPLYTIALQHAAPPQAMGSITALITFVRQLGSTVGVAVMGSVFASTLALQLAARVPEATKGLPPEVVARFQRPDAAPEAFDAEALKHQVDERLDAALQVSERALRGEFLARQLVLASPFADEALKDAVRDGAAGEAARAQVTVVRSKVRAAAEDDAEWKALREANPQVPLPGAAPRTEAARTQLDATLEEAADAAVARVVEEQLGRVKAQLEARRPSLLAAVDAVERAVHAAFTRALVDALWWALAWVALALLFTLRLPERPLR